MGCRSSLPPSHLHLFLLDDANWVSLFEAARLLLAYYPALAATQQALQNGVVSGQSAFPVDISEAWKQEIQQLLVLFSPIVACTDPKNTRSSASTWPRAPR